MSSNARLIWGSTSLLPTPAEEAAYRAGTTPYLIEATADGTTWGNPAAVITQIRSHLQDGSLAAITSYDNRKGTVRLRVTSKTYAGLDAGGIALASEQRVASYSTLSWTPSAALAVPTVFDVVYAELAWQFDDFSEASVGARPLRRTFLATFELLPFGRDAVATTVQATSGTAPVTPTTVSVNDGSSATGWSGAAAVSNGSTTLTPYSVGSLTGRIQLVPSYKGPAALRYAATIAVSTTSIIYIDANGDYALTPRAFANSPSADGYAGGTELALLAQTSQGSYTRYYFQVPGSLGSSISSVTLLAQINGGAYTLNIDQVSRTNVLPGSGTSRQQSRSLTVGGSARARAALANPAGTGTTLGDTTMVYTRTATTGLQPPLRASYLISSASVSADSTVVSGNRNSLGGTAMVFNIPANKIQEAAHNLVLRLRATTLGTYTITWTAALASSANADITETVQSITGTTSVTFPAANVWQTNEVGLLQLPTVPVAPDSTHMIRLTLLASSSVVQIDEAWLFDLDNGILSWLNTTGLTRLEIRTADTTNPEPSYWGGTVDGGAATGLVRADWRTVPASTVSASNGGSFAQHFFDPGTMDVFTVTTDTQTSAASATFCRAFLHNVSS